MGSTVTVVALFGIAIVLAVPGGVRTASAAVAANGGSTTVASVSTRVCHEAASVSIVCSFAGPPPFGTSASSLELVKYLSHAPFTASDPSELVDFTGSPTSQPVAVVDTASWRLRQPWSSYSDRYNQTVAHNATSVTFHILSAIAEDSGYYGCKLKSVFSTFKPLLVYAKDIAVNVTFLYGSSSSTPIVGGELSIEYDTMRSRFVEVAVKLEGTYASLPFSASLFTGRNVSLFFVVSPLTESLCREPELCVWTVRLMVQIVLSDVGQLHLDQLTLSVAHPSQERVLWRRRARLLDTSQRLDIVANRSVACSPPASAAIRVRHGRPVVVTCSVPRLWLSLPGYAAYWTVESAVQFYPVGRVSCAYPPVGPWPGTTYAAGDADMVDPPAQAGGACLGNKFRSLLDANFAAGDAPNARVAYAFRVPVAYYVHAGRRVIFGVAVGVDKFAQKPLPERRYAFVVEGSLSGTKSACCPLAAGRVALLTPVLLLLLLWQPG